MTTTSGESFCGKRSLDGKHTCNKEPGHDMTYGHAEFTDRAVYAWGWANEEGK